MFGTGDGAAAAVAYFAIVHSCRGDSNCVGTVLDFVTIGIEKGENLSVNSEVLWAYRACWRKINHVWFFGIGVAGHGIQIGLKEGGITSIAGTI